MELTPDYLIQKRVLLRREREAVHQRRAEAQRAVAEAQVALGAVDSKLELLDAMIAEVSGNSREGAREYVIANSALNRYVRPVSVKDAVAAWVKEQTGEFRAEDAYEALKDTVPDLKIQTIQNELSRHYMNKEVTRLGKGVYRLMTPQERARPDSEIFATMDEEPAQPIRIEWPLPVGERGPA